jgi:phosphatidylserine/phosphatidylglycerophosphate/cardiolipin synthase-like enzyme
MAGAGGPRVAVYDLENEQGTPIYVHAKAVVIDDVWAMVGSANLNRRSWTHDSEVACAVLDQERDPASPPTRSQASRSGGRPRPGSRPGTTAGTRGPRPPGRVRRHHVELAAALKARWAQVLCRVAIDPDGRPCPCAATPRCRRGPRSSPDQR